MKGYTFFHSLFPVPVSSKILVMLGLASCLGAVCGLLLGGSLASVGASLGVAMIATFAMVSMLMAPIRQLNETLEKWGQTGRVQHLHLGTSDEFGVILSRTNVLLARAQRNLDRAWSDKDCDPITGALTHNAFNRLLEDAGSGWLIGFDIGGFAAFRKVHGQTISDEFLIHVAHTCTEVIRQDDMVSRFEDHAFVVFLPGASQDVAERIVGRISAELGMNSGTARKDGLRTDFGIAAYPGGGDVGAAIEEVRSAIGRAGGFRSAGETSENQSDAA